MSCKEMVSSKHLSNNTVGRAMFFSHCFITELTKTFGSLFAWRQAIAVKTRFIYWTLLKHFNYKINSKGEYSSN